VHQLKATHHWSSMSVMGCFQLVQEYAATSGTFEALFFKVTNGPFFRSLMGLLLRQSGCYPRPRPELSCCLSYRPFFTHLLSLLPCDVHRSCYT
jgi:hypothetical protein